MLIVLDSSGVEIERVGVVPNPPREASDDLDLHRSVAIGRLVEHDFDDEDPVDDR